VEPATRKFKRPESVLVVVATRAGRVLLLQRSDDPAFWQSVTGSLRWGEETPREAAERELREETGLPANGLIDLNMTQRFPILPAWRSRYAPNVMENLEHAFVLWVPAEQAISLNPEEHLAYGWYSFREALGKASSWSNRQVIDRLAKDKEESA